MVLRARRAESVYESVHVPHIDDTLLIVTQNYKHIEYTSLCIRALKSLTFILLLPDTGTVIATIINTTCTANCEQVKVVHRLFL
jgi:hypothetical protein